MSTRISRAHLDAHNRRVATATEDLRRERGAEAIGKLDACVLADVIHVRREADLDGFLGPLGSAAERRAAVKQRAVRAFVNVRSGRRRERGEDRGRAKSSVASEETLRREKTRKRQLAIRRGRLATKKIADSLRRRGAKVEGSFWLTHSVGTSGGPGAILAMAQRKDVSSISNNKRFFAMALDTSRSLIRADQVETVLGFNGKGVNVGVLDTGVDGAHKCLKGAVVAQYDFTGEGIGDLHGHGTHCAGVVGSRCDDFRGIAPGCQIHDFKILDQNGSTDSAIAVAGIQDATARGMDVVSNSWGFSHAGGNWVCAAGDCVLCVAADNASIAGTTFVVAGGNEDNDTCSTYDTHIRCPGNSIRALTIGASDDADNMASFSSLGPTPDGRPKPDVTAPGVDIGSCEAGTLDGIVDMSGTSMACPHVAGLCALILQKNPALLPAQVKNIVRVTAIDIGATQDEMGEGRVDAAAAVNAA